jgi:hypothetical protein
VELEETWRLEITPDDVLRGQGADPAVIRRRSPHLFHVAERALEEGLNLIQPRVVQERFSVESVRHDRLLLEGGQALRGQLIAQHLAPAEEVVVIVCTIGSALEESSSAAVGRDLVHAMALYGVGSAAVEVLANSACRRIELEAAGRALQTTIPLSPGMIGWSVEEGQPQIFRLLDTAPIGVELNAGGVMTPLKSLSMVMGLGRKMTHQGRTCDYCAMKATCHYRDDG